MKKTGTILVFTRFSLGDICVIRGKNSASWWIVHGEETKWADCLGGHDDIFDYYKGMYYTKTESVGVIR